MDDGLCDRDYPNGQTFRREARGFIVRDPAQSSCAPTYAVHETADRTCLRENHRTLSGWIIPRFFFAGGAQRPGAYFKIPSSQVMEIGIEFEM